MGEAMSKVRWSQFCASVASLKLVLYEKNMPTIINLLVSILTLLLLKRYTTSFGGTFKKSYPRWSLKLVSLAVVLDAWTTCCRFCPERTKSFPEAGEVGKQKKCQCMTLMTICKTSQMNMENSAGVSDLARGGMSEGLFPSKEKAIIGL